jgi:HEAT repeat protein
VIRGTHIPEFSDASQKRGGRKRFSEASLTAAALLVAVCLFLPPCRAEYLIDSPMYKLPDLPYPVIVDVFPERAKALWVQALERPEVDLRCKAAQAVAEASRRGVKGLETTTGPLRAALDRLDQDPAVRVAAAQALIALDAREAAPSLLRHAQSGGSDLGNLIEPALARWAYRPARVAWRERLGEPSAAPWGLTLAARGLAAVGEGPDGDRLRELVLADRVPEPVRLEAARALALLRPAGLEKDAERLASDTSPRGIGARLAAASLLRRHSGPDAVRLLQGLARDPEPAVAAIAAGRLVEIDTKLLVPALDHLLASPDEKVRAAAVEVLFRQPDPQHLRLLADSLDDPHPDVRTQARRDLEELAAKKEFHAPVIAEGMRMLGTRQWRALEQAAFLLTRLGHKPAAGRLVELLPFERDEVIVAAAWGLRKLDVPETLPGVVSYIEVTRKLLAATTADLPRAGVTVTGLDQQLSQLHQLLGQRKYAPADALLRAFVPKPVRQPIGPEQRTAAVWALGLIHEGKAVPELATALEGRLNDINAIPPEVLPVRYMSAITLGRLQAKGALPSLRKFYPDREPSRSSVNNACGWAIERITGEAVPAPKPIRIVQRDWFLVPND